MNMPLTQSLQNQLRHDCRWFGPVAHEGIKPLSPPKAFVQRSTAALVALVSLTILASPRAASAQVKGFVNALGVKVAKKHPGTPGVTIVSVTPDSAGAKVYQTDRGSASLDRGDVIFTVNNQNINSVKDFDRVIKDLSPGATVRIRLRDGQNGAWFNWQGTMPDPDTDTDTDP